MIGENVLVFLLENRWAINPWFCCQIIIIPELFIISKEREKDQETNWRYLVWPLFMNISNTWVAQYFLTKWRWIEVNLLFLTNKANSHFAFDFDFDFLDIIRVVISKVVHHKIQSSAAMSSMDFGFILARSMIENFCNWKRAVPTS